VSVGKRQQQIRAMRGQLWSPADRRRRAARIGCASGRRSHAARRVRTLLHRPECHPRLAAGGPPGWRDATDHVDPRVGPIPVLLRARGDRALARLEGWGARDRSRIGRSPSTISRELRRNASTRNHGTPYRATTAQWHAERRASRPKVSKLAANEALRDYVQEPRRHDRPTGRDAGGWSRCPLDRPSARPASRPRMGQVVEPRADHQPAARRFP
jgi:hypothetical protein